MLHCMIRLRPDLESTHQVGHFDIWFIQIGQIEVDFCFGLQQERLCKTDLSGLKLSASIANPCFKLLCTEVRQVYQIFRNQTLVL